jgi:hypothetical protein
MPLLPLNSVGGYSTGITGTAVIDANGNITGVGATFSSLVRFNAGISAAGGTFGDVYASNFYGNGINSTCQIGYNGYFRGPQWLDSNGGRTRIAYGWASSPYSIDFKVDGTGFDGSGELTRMQIFASGVSFSRGGTFASNVQAATYTETSNQIRVTNNARSWFL